MPSQGPMWFVHIPYNIHGEALMDGILVTGVGLPQYKNDPTKTMQEKPAVGAQNLPPRVKEVSWKMSPASPHRKKSLRSIFSNTGFGVIAMASRALRTPNLS